MQNSYLNIFHCRFLYQLLYEAIMIGNTSQQIASIDPQNYSAIKQRFAALNTIYSNSDSHGKFSVLQIRPR